MVPMPKDPTNVVLTVVLWCGTDLAWICTQSTHDLRHPNRTHSPTKQLVAISYAHVKRENIRGSVHRTAAHIVNNAASREQAQSE
jgi:hypothetical protein